MEQIKPAQSHTESGTQIPEGWMLVTNRHLFSERNQRGMPEKRLLSVTQANGIIPQSDYDLKKDTSNEDKSNYKLVMPGDIVYNKMRMWQGAVGVSNYEGIVSPAYVVLQPRDGVDSRFYHYFFRTNYYVTQSRSHSYGLCDDMNSLRYEDFRKMESLWPPIEEQLKIIEHLEHKTNQINLFIQKKQRFIELLKEQRLGIAASLTQYDKSNEKYPIRRIKSFCQILRGKFTHRPRNDERLYGGEYPFIQTGEVSQANKYIYNYKQTLNEWGYSVSKEFPKDTLCMTIAANVGDVAILNFNACFPDSIVGIIPNDEANLDYLFYILNSIKESFISESTLTTQYNLNIERIGPIEISLPKISIQKEIVTVIESETFHIDRAISKAEKEIELIKEYREAWIAEMVMGNTD